MNPVRFEVGDGLVVRTYILDDDEELFALVDANRAHLRPWMIWEPMTKSVADQRAFIQRCLDDTQYEGNGIWLDGRLIGGIGLTLDPMANSGEIGYWLDAGHVGYGYVTRACERFLAFAFDELGLHRVELQAAVGNERSCAVARRLGMTEEGIARDGARVADGYLDLVVFSLLEDEWRARRLET